MISYRQMLRFHHDLNPLHQQSSQEVIVVDLPHDSFLVDHVHHGGGDGLAVGQRWETLHSRLCVKGRHSKYSTEFRDTHLSRSWNGVTRVICFMRKFYYWFPPRLMRVKRFNGDKHPRLTSNGIVVVAAGLVHTLYEMGGHTASELNILHQKWESICIAID